MITSTVDGEEIAGADVTGGDDEWEDGELERLIREHGTLDLVEHFRDCALSKELNACVQAGPALNADEVRCLFVDRGRTHLFGRWPKWRR